MLKPPGVRKAMPIEAERLEEWAMAYLRHAPFSLVLRELTRLVAIEALDAAEPPREPVLDVGCGDGFWWTLRDTEGRQIYGVDISAREVKQAAQRIHAVVSDVSKAPPFPDQRFGQIVGNCSLEHVRDIDSALRNLRAAAAPGARLVMFVPSAQWAYQGYTQQFLLKHFPRVSMAWAGAMNGFFQHWHLYAAPVWMRLLEQNGWRVVRVEGLGNRRAEFLFRLFMPPSFFHFLAKQVAGVYPARLYKYLPDSWLSGAKRLARWAVHDPFVPHDSPHAYEYLLLAEAT